MSVYNLSHWVWHGAHGLNLLLITWLIVFEFGLGARELSVSQFLLYAPALLLVGFAGTLANNSDCRRIVAGIHLVFAGLLLALLLQFEFLSLSFPIVCLYALAVGILGALMNPAKNAMLSDIETGASMKSSVVGSLSIEFSSRLAGVIAAAILSLKTLSALLATLSAAMFVTGLMLLKIRLRTRQQSPEHIPGKTLQSSTFRVLMSPTVGPVILSQVLLGSFSIGSFLVIIPLSVRDIGNGQIFDVSMISLFFWAGCILGSQILNRIRIRPFFIPFGMILISPCIYAFSFDATPYTYWIFAIIWGVGVAVSRTAGRLFLQSYNPRESLGSALALSQAALVGSGPLGAVGLAMIVDTAGLLTANLVASLSLASLGLLALGVLLLGNRFLHPSISESAPPDQATIAPDAPLR